MRVLVAPAAFDRSLRASVVAAAIGRGLEAAGLEPPDLCPVCDGGAGTLEVLLGRLGGETAAAWVSDPGGRPRDVGFALLDGGGSAVIECAAASGRPSAGAPAPAGTRGVGELIAAAVAAGAEVVILAPGGPVMPDGGAGAIAAITAAGGLHGARLVVLCAEGRPERRPQEAGGLAGALRAACGAELRSGAQFVLEALDFDARMRAARAVVVGTGHLDGGALEGRVVAEAAVRARQAGVPAHAIVGACDLSRFDARILDLQEILIASGRSQLEAAGRALGRRL